MKGIQENFDDECGDYVDEESGDFDDASCDLDDDCDDSSEDLDDAFALYLEAACQGNRVNESENKTPAELWSEFLDNSSKTLKVTDECVDRFELKDSASADLVIQSVMNNPGLTHVILGHDFLKLVDQVRLFGALASHHANTLRYLKISPGLERESQLQVGALLATLQRTSHLAELELHNLILQQNEAQIEILVDFFMTSSLRQIYIFGVDVHGTEQLGKLDPVFRALSSLEALDELRLQGLGSPPVGSLVSPSALEDLLRIKQKWWRLGLDNMGLSDDHCSVISTMFARNQDCRVGDLLSLQSNPAISQEGYKMMFTVFFQKGRMGLVKVDEPRWEAEFDLVRSMNNLHGRLDVIVDGKVTSRDKYINWLAQICARNAWEPDNKKLNYLWYALREHPCVFEIHNKETS